MTKKIIFIHITSLLLILSLLPAAIAVPSENPAAWRQIMYQAFVNERMDLWLKAMEQMEAEYKKRRDADLLFELAMARYGYTGYSLGTDNKDEARRQISLAEDEIKKLAGIPRYESSSYALQAAFYAYRISISPWRAVFWGQRSMRLIEQAIEAGPGNPQGWIEHGNAMFYAPSAFGGSKEKAVESYSRAVRLMENNLEDTHKWLYLNTLVGLARSYQETGNLAMARLTYMKILEFEPGFKWVRDRLLPGLPAE